MSNNDFFDTTKMPHVMVDLETMSTRPNAAILTIGAVTFDLHSLTLGENFYTSLDLQSCVDLGLHIDPQTVRWWLQQSDAARKDATGGAQLALPEALQQLAAWLDTNTVALKNRCVWGNGANFDPVILESAYRAAGIETPWMFWGSRCFRTIKSLYPNVEPDPRMGTHHNALDDAINQVEHLFKIRRTLRGNK